MINSLSFKIRVLTFVGTLFFFVDCAGNSKPYNFSDIQSLDVRILDTKDWRIKTKRNLRDLDKIIRPQLKYYLKKDFRIYEKIDNPYESMKSSFSRIDSIYKNMYGLIKKMKKTSSDSLDDIPKDTTVSYRTLIESSRKRIKSQNKIYYKNIKKLQKGFRSIKKRLIFVDEMCNPLKISIYELQYRRNLEQAKIERFNKKLNEALFIKTGSSYSKRIIEMSKTLEMYRVKLDSFERFLLNIESVASKELGGTVALIPKSKMPPRFIKKYENGKKEYLEILIEIRKITNSM